MLHPPVFGPVSIGWTVGIIGIQVMHSSGFTTATLRIVLQTAFICAATQMAQAQTVSVLADAVATPLAAASTSADSGVVPGATVINMIAGGSVSSDLTNSSVALSNGGLFAGAYNGTAQQGTNQLNIYGTLPSLPSGGVSVAALPLLGGAGQSVTLNMSAGASALSPVSMTVNNINASVSAGTNPVTGGSAAVNAAWTGGYGGSLGGAFVGGLQSGGNALNGTTMAFAPGTQVTLSQTGGSGGAVAGLPNMSTVNTMFGYGASGNVSVGGMAPATVTLPVFGGQTATNSVNSATLAGAATLNIQQVSSGTSASTTQAVNRALALSAPTPVLVPVH